MIDMERIRRLNKYDRNSLIAVLELNEDRLYVWLVVGSITAVRDNLESSINFVEPLRELIRSEWPDYVSPWEPLFGQVDGYSHVRPCLSRKNACKQNVHFSFRFTIGIVHLGQWKRTAILVRDITTLGANVGNSPMLNRYTEENVAENRSG